MLPRMPLTLLAPLQPALLTLLRTLALLLLTRPRKLPRTLLTPLAMLLTQPRTLLRMQALLLLTLPSRLLTLHRTLLLPLKTLLPSNCCSTAA